MDENPSSHASQDNNSSWNQIRPAKISKLVFILLFILLPFIGFYLGMEYQKKLSPVGPKAIEDSSTSVVRHDSDLKTYTNKELGFSFQYPATWEIENKSYEGRFGYEGVLLSPTENELFRNAFMSIVKVKNDSKSIREYFNQYDYYASNEPMYLGDWIMRIPPTKINGLEARIMMNPPIHNPLGLVTEVTWIFFEKNSEIYQIDVIKDTEFNPELFQTHVDQILSTFKFTE